MNNSHFNGKSVFEHILSAHKKTAKNVGESHNMHTPFFMHILENTLFFSSLLFISLFTLLTAINQAATPSLIASIVGLFSIVYICNEAISNTRKLHRLHRVVEEERNEIVTNKDEEIDELRELFRAKGLSGNVLDTAVLAVSEDEDLLLDVMLKEELGLEPGTYRHPSITPIVYSFVFTLSIALLYFSLVISPVCLHIMSLFFLFTSSIITSYFEKISVVSISVWNIAALISISIIAKVLSDIL